LLTELNNTLQVIIKDFLALKVSLAVRKTVLVSFNHHENYFLILIWAFKEILQEALFKNFLHFSILVIVLSFHVISIFILVLPNLLIFFFLYIFPLLFSRWIIINCVIFTLLLHFIVIIFDEWGWSLFFLFSFFSVIFHFNFETVSWL
jgi:hypothetical protein